MGKKVPRCSKTTVRNEQIGRVDDCVGLIENCIEELFILHSCATFSVYFVECSSSWSFAFTKTSEKYIHKNLIYQVRLDTMVNQYLAMSYDLGSLVSGSFPTKGVSGIGMNEAVDEVNKAATVMITPQMNMFSFAV